MLLDPSSAQLLVADLQPSLIAQSATETPAVIASSATALAGLASELGVPITFSLVPEESGDATPIDGLRHLASPANSFLRQSASPFLDPAATAAMAGHGRRILLIVGFATEVAVLHAALDAIAAGYTVFVPVDAIGGQSVRTERAALDQIGRAGGTITSAFSLISMLAPDFSNAPGDAALGRLRALGAARQTQSS